MKRLLAISFIAFLSAATFAFSDSLTIPTRQELVKAFSVDDEDNYGNDKTGVSITREGLAELYAHVHNDPANVSIYDRFEDAKFEVNITIRYNEMNAEELANIARKVAIQHGEACAVEFKATKIEPTTWISSTIIYPPGGFDETEGIIDPGETVGTIGPAN